MYLSDVLLLGPVTTLSVDRSYHVSTKNIKEKEIIEALPESASHAGSEDKPAELQGEHQNADDSQLLAH